MKISNLKYPLLLVILTINTVIFAQKKFVISGQIDGKEGRVVSLKRFTENAIQPLGADTIKNGKFNLTIPVDELSLAVLEVDNKFGGTVVVEPVKLNYIMDASGSYGTKGGKYTPILTGYLKLPDYTEADELFKKLTKGGDIAAIKGTKAEWEMIAPFLKKEDIRTAYLVNLIQNNPDPCVKAMAAIMSELQPDASKTMKMIEEVAAQVGEQTIMMRRIRSMARQQAEALARRQAGMLGEQFVDLTAAKLNGEVVTLSPIVQNNRYTLLQFWASWCGPCRKEIPLLKKIYSEYKGKGFEIVSFSMDDNRYNWEKASEAEAMEWINISDLRAFNSSVAKTYPIFGIPANVIIDQTGKIVASNLLDEELESKIVELFK